MILFRILYVLILMHLKFVLRVGRYLTGSKKQNQDWITKIITLRHEKIELVLSDYL